MNRFKNNRRNGLNVLDDDAGHFKEEEDVYDLVDQDEYRNLVESRRQREDFVVDDGKFEMEEFFATYNLTLDILLNSTHYFSVCVILQTELGTTMTERNAWATKRTSCVARKPSVAALPI